MNINQVDPNAKYTVKQTITEVESGQVIDELVETLDGSSITTMAMYSDDIVPITEGRMVLVTYHAKSKVKSVVALA